MPIRDSYQEVATLYDIFVQADFDVPFFRERVSRCTGRVLELMAGTGRLSSTLFEHNPRLTCVDISKAMLHVLSGKFPRAGSGPAVVCADIRSLPLRSKYELAIIAFTSFAELTSVEDQRKAMAELSRVIAPGGEIICTLHNPPVRQAALDGKQRALGRYEVEQGREVEVLVTGTLDRDTGVAQSRQLFRIWDADGELVNELLQNVHFALISEDWFAELAVSSGFVVVELVGDYDGSAYARNTSPFMIWTIRKA